MSADDGVVVTADILIPAGELRWRFSRSSGPGGQGVNTTDSRVELSWDATSSDAIPEHLRERVLRRLAPRSIDGEVRIAASEFRSQRRNREAALDRLADLMREAIAPPPPPRRPTRPSRAAKRRRLDSKRRRGETKRLRSNPDF